MFKLFHEEIDFSLTHKERLLRQMAIDYHTQTDSFDRKVCSGKDKHGDPTPATRAQFIMINQNAYETFNNIYQKNIGLLSITKKEFRVAIQKYPNF